MCLPTNDQHQTQKSSHATLANSNLVPRCPLTSVTTLQLGFKCCHPQHCALQTAVSSFLSPLHEDQLLAPLRLGALPNMHEILWRLSPVQNIPCLPAHLGPRQAGLMEKILWSAVVNDPSLPL